MVRSIRIEPRKSSNNSQGDGVLTRGVDHRGQHRIVVVGGARHQAVEQLGRQALQPLRVRRCRSDESKSSRMSSARLANPYSACTAGRCCGASSRVARKKVRP